jgi:hypothetical protein
MTMAPDPTTVAGHASRSEALLRRLLGGMSVFIGHQAAGVSVLSWSAYLLSAVLWLWYGIQKRDKNIYLPCVGWIALDSAVIAGAAIYG